MVLLVQKEVAERIAREKKESILSLSVKAYGAPKYIKTVPAGAFSPPPAVDSAILAIEKISRNNFASEVQEKRFFELLHAGFAHKRKLLARNLENVLGTDTAAAMERVDIPLKARAEDIPLRQWLVLSDH
jgi:16S rRNA (adenine1518-N6/adenine1519-N6)-dimethyltransferase